MWVEVSGIQLDLVPVQKLAQVLVEVWVEGWGLQLDLVLDLAMVQNSSV